MKLLSLSLVLLMAASLSAQQGTLVRAEPLTAVQEKQLAAAGKAVLDAQQALLNVQAKIAAEHKMKEENWMEWRSWYEFDGKFILYRSEGYMGTTFTSTAGAKP